MRSLPLHSDSSPTKTPGAPVREAPIELPAAILSLHSHRDRSFLHDVTLHHLSGQLRLAGFQNDLVACWLPTETNPGKGDEFEKLVEALRAYPTVMYERMWTPEIAQRLRDSLPGVTLIRLVGEHDMKGAPADYVCRADLGMLGTLLGQLTKRGFELPSTKYAPNLQCVYATEESRPTFHCFPIIGNPGCPYQTDARENPVYEGVPIPKGMGRGCSFCVTGNHYEHMSHAEAVRWSLEQLRYIRGNAPEISYLVLRDQNPFYYLTELIETAEKERLGPFTLLMESRADWFLQNETRFTRALASANRSSIKLAPFLVGVENFSQPELDRFNKGITAERNVQFLLKLAEWHAAYKPAMDLSHTAFGFIMFTPWTTLSDLRNNLDGIRRTKMHEMRGNLLLSRARLYPDTALYYLAAHEDLLVDKYKSARDDSSARYGYLPAQPWRFKDPKAARVSELSQIILERRRTRNEPLLLETMIDLVEKADDPASVTPEDVERVLDKAEGGAGQRRAGPANADASGPRRKPVSEAAAAMKVEIARSLVNAPSLPLPLPAFQLTLLDVEADLGGVELVLGAPDPIGALRLSPDEHAPTPIVIVKTQGDARRWARPLAVLAERVRRATTPERWEKAWSIAGVLARL